MSTQQPPNVPRRFLHWFCDESLFEEIDGDLHEAYLKNQKTKGETKANISYWLDVLRFFKPYSFEKYSSTKQYLPMVKNYLIIAIRNILKRKGFTAINVGGLSISLTVLILVTVFIRYHLTFDSHYPNIENVYRIGDNYRSQSYAPFKFDGYWDASKESQMRLVNLLKSYPEVKSAAQFLQSASEISGQEIYYIEVGEQRFREDNLVFTNTPKDFFEIFPQKIIKGSQASFESSINSILLTERTAIKLLGHHWESEEIAGTICKIGGENYAIAGVVQEPIPNSHFGFNILVHREIIPSWGAYTYMKINEEMEHSTVLARLQNQMDKVIPGYSTDILEKGPYAVSVEDIHIADGSLLYELRPVISVTTLKIFSAIALVILLITWTNYTNLTVAVYTQRQKELGVRKVLGARSKDIGLQMFTEITLIACLSLPVALAIAHFILPSFSHLMDIGLDYNALFDPMVLLIIFGVTLLTGILSSAYPVLAFGSRKEIGLIKSKLSFKGGKYQFGVRRALIGLQFLLLISLVSMSAYTYQQMEFVATKDMGFDSSGIISIPASNIQQHQAIKSVLLQIPDIEAVGAGYMPGAEMWNQTTYKLEGENEVFDDAHILNFDIGMAEALGWDHIALNQLRDGKKAVRLINESMAQRMKDAYGYTELDLINKRVITEPEYVDDETGEIGVPYIIDGIIGDFHFFSLKNKVNPLIVQIGKNLSWTTNTVIKLKDGANLAVSLGRIEDLHSELEPELPFELIFLDERIEQLYKSEQRMLTLMGILSTTAIGLAIMGLIGLVSYMVYIKRKEMGIRKVFGASVTQILVIINKEFVVLMLVASVLAVPIIYWAMQLWLSDFAYRISLNPLVIIVSAIISLSLVILIVSLQSSKAATINPKDLLSEE